MKPEDVGHEKPRDNPVEMVRNGERILVSTSAVQFRLSKGWRLLGGPAGIAHGSQYYGIYATDSDFERVDDGTAQDVEEDWSHYD